MARRKRGSLPPRQQRAMRELGADRDDGHSAALGRRGKAKLRETIRRDSTLVRSGFLELLNARSLDEVVAAAVGEEFSRNLSNLDRETLRIGSGPSAGLQNRPNGRALCGSSSTAAPGGRKAPRGLHARGTGAFASRRPATAKAGPHSPRRARRAE